MTAAADKDRRKMKIYFYRKGSLFAANMPVNSTLDEIASEIYNASFPVVCKIPHDEKLFWREYAKSAVRCGGDFEAFMKKRRLLHRLSSLCRFWK